MFVQAGSVMREGEVVATISDPATPGMTVDIVAAPEDGLIIGAATNPFAAAGMPVGRFLPISKHFALLEEQIDDNGQFIVNGVKRNGCGVKSTKSAKSRSTGEWSGEVDSEWIGSKPTGDEKDFEEEEAA